jgi:activator of HSP90 ATPase
MAGGKGTSYQTNVRDWLLTTNTVTRPTSWTIALYTDVTGSSNQPTSEATTSNCPGYARQSATFSSGANTNDIAFTATGAWATVNYYGILDQSGNIIYWSPLSTSRTLQVSGDKLDFAVGAITVSEK